MPRRLSVAVVAPLVAPLRDGLPYGNQAFLVDLARGLAARGHDVAVYCAEGSRASGVALVTLPVPMECRGAFALLAPDAPPLAAMREAFATLFAAVRGGEHDVVSQHAFDAEAIELAAGLPTLHTLHLPPMVGRVVQACRRTRAPLATVSGSAQQDWLRAGVPTTVLSNGVPDVAPRAGAIEDVALVAGRIAPEKGTTDAVRLARAAGLRPLVVGEPYDRLYFEAEVRPLLGPGELCPAVRRRELWSLMARCAVTLAPVRWDEPFGLVAAEAQMAGCPVVAYRRGALPEVVEDGVSGILAPAGEERVFVAAIRRAIELDRRAVRASARRRLRLDTAVVAYEHALASVAGAAAGAA